MKFIYLFALSFVILSFNLNCRTTKYQVLSDDLPCQMFPANNIWNTPIDEMPVDSNSDAYVTTIGAAKFLHPDFGAGQWNGAPIGIPYVIVPGTQPKLPISFDYPDESDAGPYPIPEDAPIEGSDSSNGDRHVLIVDKDNCMLYEIYLAYSNHDGSWRGGSGAIFDFKSNQLRPDSWTSADAAGLPILPGLLRYEEIAKGEINHAIRLTVPKTQRAYVWPARHYASSFTGTQYPPMGQRFRLKKDYDITNFSETNKIILRALKKYGLLLADNGSAWFITGAPDSRWDDYDLIDLKSIPGSEFEAVDCTSLMIDPNSGEAKQSPSAISENNTESPNLTCSPNPSQNILKINFNITSPQNTSLSIINYYGSKIVDILSSQEQSQGQHSLEANISQLSSGVYFLILKTNSKTETKKFVIIR